MKGLVIVDMQDYFINDSQLNESICKQIDRFKDKRWPIVILEYRWNPYDPDDSRCGRTNDVLLHKLAGYRNLAVFGKADDDGSEDMRDYVYRCMHTVDELVLVGVNLDCCVMSTAEGLAASHSEKQITILAECCGSRSCCAMTNGYDYVVEKLAKEMEHEMTASNLRLQLEYREVVE